MAKREEIIELKEISPRTINVHIVGDTDLILNKMNDVAKRNLTEERKDKAKTLEKSNVWEEIITAVHWLKGKPKEFTEESLKDCLKNNKPCISAFGLKQSFGDAVTRNGIDTYATKIKACLNINVPNGLIPIEWTEHCVDEKLIPPPGKKGSPVLSRQNRFTGWSAVIPVTFTDNIYSTEQIVNIINLAGFGLGIGSGRSGGFGRYHIEGVEIAEA